MIQLLVFFSCISFNFSVVTSVELFKSHSGLSFDGLLESSIGSGLQPLTKGHNGLVNSFHVSTTPRNIIAVRSNVVFSGMCSGITLTLIFSTHLSQRFEIAPRAPTTTGITSAFLVAQMVALSHFVQVAKNATEPDADPPQERARINFSSVYSHSCF